MAFSVMSYHYQYNTHNESKYLPRRLHYI